MDRKREKLLSRDLLLVLGMFALGTVLGLQGWKSRTYDGMDIIPCVDSALVFLRTGAIPTRGMLNTFATYNPPGTSWLYIPGVYLFSDPVLFGYPTSAVFYLGTLFGIYFLIRDGFGGECALLAVIIYSLSAFGIDSSTSLWSRFQMPFFYVWFTYCAYRWVLKNNSWYLSGAVALSLTAAYVFMEILPIMAVIPVLWILYRRNVRPLAILPGFLFCLLLWLPYLRYEWTRGFSDLRAQLFRIDMLPENYKTAWCDPSLVVYDWKDGLLTESTVIFAHRRAEVDAAGYGLFKIAACKARAACSGLIENVSRFLVPLPGVNVVLFLVVLVNCVLLGLANTSVPFRLPERLRGPHSVVVLLAFLVPALLFFLFAEIGRSDRFIFFWPLQCILLAIFSCHTIRFFVGRDSIIKSFQVTIILVTICNTLLLSRLNSWINQGWTGQESFKRLAVECLAEDIQRNSSTKAGIGYQVFFPHYVPAFHVNDPRYKVGADFDLMLRGMYGIGNETTCAEGFSKADLYRIVTDEPTGEHLSTFAIPLEKNFLPIGQFGPYRVYKRVEM